MDFEERFLLAGRKMAFLENEDEEIVITGILSTLLLLFLDLV